MDPIAYMKALAFQKSEVPIVNRAMRHLMAGGVGTLGYMAAVAVFVEIFSFHPVVSTVIAYAGLETYTYAIYRGWVYQPTSDHGYAVPRFLITSVVALFLNAAIMYVVVETFGLWYVWGLIGTTLVVPPTNFLLNYCWAFK